MTAGDGTQGGAQGDGRWMTYAELGEALGVSAATAQRRVFRSKWQRQPGNDGKARVLVPLSVLHGAQDKLSDSQGAPAPELGRLVDRIEALETRLEEARSAHAADREAWAKEREAWATEREAWATERGELREHLARREGEMAGLKAGLERGLVRGFLARFLGPKA